MKPVTDTWLHKWVRNYQTIFTRHKTLNTYDKEVEYVCDKSTSLVIENSWKHVLAIARNQMEDLNLPTNNHQISTTENTYTERPQHHILADQLGQPHNELYDRERLMVQALDTLFSVACEESGYIDFLATMTKLLDPDCPVSMAFLSHVIDRATLPSKSTMSHVSSALISKLNVKFITVTSTDNLDDDCGGGRSGKRWTSWISHHHSSTHRIVCEFGAKVDDRMKRNALLIWSILAEKFAGDMVHLLWTPSVANLLFYLLSSNTEIWTVRVFALLALEKFALTGDIKTSILLHPLQIQIALRQAIYDSKYDTGSDNMSSAQTAAKHKTNDITGTSFFRTLRKRPEWPYMDWISTYMHKLANRKHLSQSKQHTLHPFNIRPCAQHQSQHRQTNDSDPMDEDGLDSDGKDPDDDNLSRFALTEHDESSTQRYSRDSWTGEDLYYHDGSSKSSLCLENSSKDSVMKRMELAHCAEWSLGHIFSNNPNTNTYSAWDLSGLNVIVNPFDATQHWKIGSNGLELRNDRLYFESIRATTCVKNGRWYYEVLLVTEGIMQIGWCTKRCRFVPEEGYGVGDDQHGFAFDTYRCAVWANGSAVYPHQHNPLYKCRAGDVLGSYLDMDQGICSFFINGKDLGSTVAFEHASNHNGGNNIEGLYPAFSLTTHQHILVNFGDQPWMYLPDHLSCSGTEPLPSQNEWKGINEADSMDNAFRQQVRGVTESISLGRKDKKCDGTEMETAISSSQTPEYGQDGDDQMNDDWDGPLCTMCFNEPKDTALIPCGHGGWGAECTKVLVSCPLCRSKIEGYTRQT